MGIVWKLVEEVIGRWSHYFGAFFFVNVFCLGVLFIPCIYVECQQGQTSWWIFWVVLLSYQLLAIIAGERNYQADKKTSIIEGEYEH